jgi:hypothetical protein
LRKAVSNAPLLLPPLGGVGIRSGEWETIAQTHDSRKQLRRRRSLPGLDESVWEHHAGTGAKTHLAIEAAGFGEKS